MNRLDSVALLLSIIAFGGCSLMMSPNGGSPEVTGISPANRLGRNESIGIRFSTPMDRESVEAGLTLAGPAGAVGGETSWDGKRRIVFRPSRIEPPSRYLLTLDGALSSKGVAMEPPYRHLYATVPDSAPPELRETVPEDGAEGVETEVTIELLFSKPLDRSSLYSALEIEPPLEVEYLWSEEDRRVELAPRTPLIAGTCYRLSISRECSCPEGVPLAKAYSSSFTTAEEPAPVLTGIRIDSEGTEREPDEAEVYVIEKDERLSFAFSPPVPEKERGTALEFSDHADSSVEWSEDGLSAELLFEKHLIWQELYSCRILGSRYTFLCAGEKSRPPQVEEVYFCNDTEAGSPLFTPLTHNQLLFFEDSDAAAIDIHISHGEGAELDYSSLLAHISLHATNGCLSLLLTSIELNPTSPQPPSSDSSHPFYSTVRLNFSLTSEERSGRLILEVGDEILDSWENTPEQPFLLSLNI